MRYAATLFNAAQGHTAYTALWQQAKALLTAGHKLHVTLKTETRSIAQNNLMWSCLTDLSVQVKWFGKRLTKEGWKDFITAHLNGQELVPNMDGTGFVALGKGSSTSDMTIAEMTAVIDLSHCFGDERGVIWSPTSLGREWSELAA